MPILNEIFDIEYGNEECSDKSILDNGKTLLIASQGVDNGAYGFFDVPIRYNPPIITVPRTGSIGYAFIQFSNCSVTDDCMVLIPKKQMTKEYLFYIASMIRLTKWRYNYARKITPERLGRLEVKRLEEFETSISYDELADKLIPEKQKVRQIDYRPTKKEFLLSKLFDIVTGDYHSVEDLKEGKIPLVSCSDNDNGIAGFYDIPIEKTYNNMITVAYDGRPLTAKYHDYRFVAYDNVGILIPTREYKKSTLLFITILLNIERWRYSYGRKCYRQKIENLTLKLPTKDGELDEEFIEKIIRNRDLFDYVRSISQRN